MFTVHCYPKAVKSSNSNLKYGEKGVKWTQYANISGYAFISQLQGINIVHLTISTCKINKTIPAKMVQIEVMTRSYRICQLYGIAMLSI